MKKVIISYDWWEATVTINDTPETIKYMEEQLLFWLGGASRIAGADGDIIKAYTTMLGEQLITLSMTLSLEGIKAHFDDAEGWYGIRGDYGVTLISCDEWVFDDVSVVYT